MSSVQSLAPIVHKRECLFKIIVIGDIATGKTSLIQRYVREAIPSNYKPTLGVDFATKIVTFDDSLIRLQFWDISGQERFANMTRVYYRDSHGAIIVLFFFFFNSIFSPFLFKFSVYDCKRNETLTGAFRWKKDLDSKLIMDNGQPIPAILVANKCDLENTLGEQQLADYARQRGFNAGFKLSARTGEGIDTALDFLLRNVVNAEKDGLYMMPLLQRDQQIRQLANTEESPSKKKRGKKIGRNICCS